MQTYPRHLHAATLSGCIVLLGATIAISNAANGTNAKQSRLLDSFITGGSNSMVDLAAIGAHPCYTIVGIEAQMCEQTYGLRESLHSMLDSGALRAYYEQKGVNVSALPAAASASASSEPSLFPETASSASSSVSSVRPGPRESTYQTTLTERSRLLWRACQNRYRGRDAYRCYARNTSILSRFDVPIDRNIQ